MNKKDLLKKEDAIDKYVDWSLDNIADCFYSFAHGFYDLDVISYPEKFLKDIITDEINNGSCRKYFKRLGELEGKLQEIEEEARKNEDGFDPNASIVDEVKMQYQNLMQDFSKKLFLYGVKFGTRLAKKYSKESD